MIKNNIVYAPCSGEIVKLETINDEVFAKKIIGDGVAIIPKSGKFFSPINGELVAVFPSKHAYGIQNEVMELLVHIGIDTVNLEGKGFNSLVQQKQSIKVGDLLVSVDLEVVKKTHSLATPLIFTGENHNFKVLKYGQVKIGEPIIEVK